MKTAVKKVISFWLAIIIAIALIPFTSQIARAEDKTLVSFNDCTPLYKDEEWGEYIYYYDLGNNSTTVEFTDLAGHMEDSLSGICAIQGYASAMKTNVADLLQGYRKAYDFLVDYFVEEGYLLKEDLAFLEEKEVLYATQIIDDDDDTIFVIFSAPESEIVNKDYSIKAATSLNGKPLTGISSTEKAYTYIDFTTGETVLADVYTIKVPPYTEKIKVQTNNPVLHYNYTKDGSYIGGAVDDPTNGDSEFEVVLDHPDDSGEADGKFDYIQIQTPYVGWFSALKYCITFEEDYSFTVSYNGKELTDITVEEDAYEYVPFVGDPYKVNVYTVKVPDDADEVEIEVTDPCLHYNYTADGTYIGGAVEDPTNGDKKFTAAIDLPDGSGKADGKPDYIQIQTPYDANYSSDCKYCITFEKGAQEDEPEQEVPEEVPTEVEDIYLVTRAKVDTIVRGDKALSDKEWFAMDQARDFMSVDGTFIEEYVNDIIDKKGVLHTSAGNYTNYAKAILTLTSIGIDASDVDGINLIEKLADLDAVTKQGTNGVMYALLALDSAPYDLPSDVYITRNDYIDLILAAQLKDGGWDWANKAADPDMTAMAIQALAPYYKDNYKVKAAVDKALDTLSAMQQEDGGFKSPDASGETSESASMVILALLALDIDPDADERFVKNGNSVLDNLCTFAVAGGGFSHEAGSNYNNLATDQGYRALAGYYRMVNRETTVYDMSDKNLRPVVGHLSEELYVYDGYPEEMAKEAESLILKDKTVADMNGVVICLYDIFVLVFDEDGNYFGVVTETKEDKEVEVKIPENMLSKLGEKVIIVGIHDGKTFTIEPISVDRKTGIVKFKSSQFSVYSVVSSPVENPETGDNTNSALWMIMMCISVLSVLSAVVIVSRKKLHK